jgi:hypothetical protein
MASGSPPTANNASCRNLNLEYLCLLLRISNRFQLLTKTAYDSYIFVKETRPLIRPLSDLTPRVATVNAKIILRSIQGVFFQ